MEVDPGDTPNEAAQHAFGREPLSAPRAAAAERLADWWVRAAALVLDGLVVAAIGFAVALAVIAVTGRPDHHGTTLLTYAIGIPLGLAYAPLLMIRRGARNGQTLGKQAMDIRVVREDGKPVTLGTALLREVIGRQLLIAITLYVYAPIDYLWPIWDKANQCIHDKVASTLVVRTAWAPTAPAPPPSPPRDEPIGGWLPPRAGA